MRDFWFKRIIMILSLTFLLPMVTNCARKINRSNPDPGIGDQTSLDCNPILDPTCDDTGGGDPGGGDPGGGDPGGGDPGGNDPVKPMASVTGGNFNSSTNTYTANIHGTLSQTVSSIGPNGMGCAEVIPADNGKCLNSNGQPNTGAFVSIFDSGGGLESGSSWSYNSVTDTGTFNYNNRDVKTFAGLNIRHYFYNPATSQVSDPIILSLPRLTNDGRPYVELYNSSWNIINDGSLTQSQPGVEIVFGCGPNCKACSQVIAPAQFAQPNSTCADTSSSNYRAFRGDSLGNSSRWVVSEFGLHVYGYVAADVQDFSGFTIKHFFFDPDKGGSPSDPVTLVVE